MRDILDRLEENEHVQRVGKWGFRLTAGLILLGIFLAFVGYLAGGPLPADGPAIDFGESPAEIATDSLEQLRYRSHAKTWRIQVWNRTTGEQIRDAVMFRAKIDPERRRYAVSRYYDWAEPDENETIQTCYGTRFVASCTWNGGGWNREGNPDNSYQQYYPYGKIEIFESYPVDLIEMSTVRVVRNTSSTMVLNVTKAPDTSELEYDFREFETLTLYIAKQPTPHIERMARVQRPPTTDTLSIFSVRFENVGSTTIERPDEVGSYLYESTTERIQLGLHRLSGGLIEEPI